MNEFAYLAVNYRWMHDYVDLLDPVLGLAQGPCSPLFSREGTPGDELRAQLPYLGDNSTHTTLTTQSRN
jgi:hypothetical protein